MHQFLKFIYFGITLYMFRTVFPSIIRSARLHTATGVYNLELLMMDGKTVRNM